ncbi:aldehyde dehydrogenase family protein [Paraburkholderia antibiotica]|uniref:aldehyde dehydrogenase (NAD(+)) n=1 Tax=Paraburkholderia antibiotica TaxID=2728839 RepID=A0A7X9X6A1_9BURK|nr:aldehyde dehydrogenase family protein [Paraburkholderia antibiotica]NML32293.1 aldehyde dehydrogenase family protein [Paraburkholderia antibiotica]
MLTYDQVYIGGKWLKPAHADSLDVFDAGHGSVMGRIPNASAREVDLAVAHARAALAGWSGTPPAQRATFLARIAAALNAHADRLAHLIAREVGMPLKLARAIQVELPVRNFAHYAQLAAEFAFEEQVGHSLVLREPVGVVAAITPWNYPLHQIALKVAAALAAGCTVVLKPSEVAPCNAFVLTEIVDQAQLPAGVFNLVSGTAACVGEPLVAHPDVDMISFTGSTQAGQRIAELAAPAMKRVALELGGKSASLILDDADLALAVRASVNRCFLNSGQTCTALTRMLVPRALHDEAARLAQAASERLTPGDPLAPDTKLGPLTSAAQAARVRAHIATGVAEGATLVTGGTDFPQGVPAGGFYVQPTVFANVDNRMTIAQEEIFGPVLCIIPYDDDEHAIALANDSRYGLAGAVWSSDPLRARQVAKRIRAGQVDVNGAPFNPDAPFGGFRMSGRGREGGKYGLEEFLEYKALQL